MQGFVCLCWERNYFLDGSWYIYKENSDMKNSMKVVEFEDTEDDLKTCETKLLL